MRGMDFEERFDLRRVPFEICGASTDVEVEEYVLITKGVQEFGRAREIGFGVGAALDEETARTSHAGFVMEVDDVTVAAVDGGGTPLTSEVGEKFTLLVVARGDLAYMLPDVL